MINNKRTIKVVSDRYDYIIKGMTTWSCMIISPYYMKNDLESINMSFIYDQNIWVDRCKYMCYVVLDILNDGTFS